MPKWSGLHYEVIGHKQACTYGRGVGTFKGFRSNPPSCFPLFNILPGYMCPSSCIKCSTTSLATMALRTPPSKHVFIATMHSVSFWGLERAHAFRARAAKWITAAGVRNFKFKGTERRTMVLVIFPYNSLYPVSPSVTPPIVSLWWRTRSVLLISLCFEWAWAWIVARSVRVSVFAWSVL